MGLALRVEEVRIGSISRASSSVINLVVPDSGEPPPPDHFREFLEAMMEYTAGNYISLRLLHQSYQKLASERAWPSTTARTLGLELVNRGCSKRIVDARWVKPKERQAKYCGVKRPVVIVFPESL